MATDSPLKAFEKYTSFKKILPLRDELFYQDGQMGRWAVRNSSTANTHEYVLLLNSTTHQPPSSGKYSITTSHNY